MDSRGDSCAGAFLLTLWTGLALGCGQSSSGVAPITAGGAGVAGDAGGRAGEGGSQGGAAGAGSAGRATGGSGGSAGSGSGGKGGAAGASSGGSGGSGANCAGYVMPSAGRSCREVLECDPGQVCVEGEGTGGCAVCIDPSRTCVTSSDCGDGSICEEYFPECSCGGSGTRCMSPCTEDSCAEGERCGASGLCEPVPCDEGHECPPDFTCAANLAVSGRDEHGCGPVPCNAGYECPENFRCTFVAGDSFPVNHGCTRVTCSSDADCDCGACVNDVCASGPGVCLSAVGAG